MFKKNLAYEASAGSGKTFMLVVRYLSLLFMGADSSKILALTFTNKAANEMSERIVETLQELQDRDELLEIVKVTNLTKEEILKNRDNILKSFLNANTKIMTIDSFFTQILRKFSLYASLMPDFSTFEAQHKQRLISEFLKSVRKNAQQDMLISLSLHSKKRFGDIFLLLDEFYQKKEQIATLKFSKQDTEIYEKQAMQALASLQSIVSLCDGASPSLKKAIRAENFEELRSKSWIVKESLEYWVFKKCFTLDMNRALHTIQESIKDYYRAKEQNFFYALNELLDTYIEAKKSLYTNEGELSFTDVTALVYYILNKIDDSEFLYFRLDANIEHILLDEFQDTSILQYEILKPLISEITSGNGIFEDGSFFFVGDVKQSIYRFRGGVSELFHIVAKQNNTEIEKLLVNYRSKKVVVDFVNKVFQNKIKNYTPQLVKDGEVGGYVEVVQNEEIVQEVQTQVQTLLNAGADINSIAILCATNSDGEEIKNYLQESGLDVLTETTTKLITQNIVKAVLEYLKYHYFKEEIYRLNFFALISQEPQDIAYIDFNKETLFNIVKNMIKRYKLYNGEFHLIKFLDAVSNYKDIEALLFEYERMDISAAMSDVSGIRILTVHKSKGLEYTNVIVVDRLKKAPASRANIIYKYEGIFLQNIYLRTQKRVEIDSSYAEAIDKEQILALEDEFNSFYVAFTRAKENLIIIKKEQKSVFDILELDIVSFGQLKCVDKQPKEPQVYDKLEFKNLYYGMQSDILALEKQNDEDLVAINFGLALHYTLEMISEFKIQAIDEAIAMMLNKFGFMLSDEEVSDLKRRVELFVESKKIKELIDGAKLYKEKALRYKNSLKYIDLLIEKDGKYIVVDYKTSTLYSDKHIKQVQGYIKAVSEITNTKVHGYICYLLTDELKMVAL
jgi:exodeoxyribonuclease V beta subunit